MENQSTPNDMLNYNTIIAGLMLIILFQIPVHSVPISTLQPIQDTITILNAYTTQTHTKQDIQTAAIQGIVQKMGDPYAKYITPQSFKQMKAKIINKQGGVGIQVGIKNNTITVITTYPDSPAEQAGILPLDEIEQINNLTTIGKSPIEIHRLLLGPVDSNITLSIRRITASKPLIFTLTRQEITQPSITKTDIFYNQIGYIKVSSFEKKTLPEELISKIKKLQTHPITALVIDIRNNGGGLISNAVILANFFMDSGPILHVKKNNTAIKPIHPTQKPLFPTLPVVILINHGSASASEIFAAALQENKRAVLVGAPTFGKTSIQQVFPISNGGAIICTTSQYLTPLKHNINETGLIPDINIPFKETPHTTPETDPQLLEAINEALLQTSYVY